MKKISQLLSLVLLFSLLLSQGAQAQEKKRWSPQAKGAVIGVGAGALGGAIIHKRNRAVGGVVGGVVGGAAGYAIGKHKDNKNKEAARVAAANRAAAAHRAEVARQNTVRAKAAAPVAVTAASLTAARPAGLYGAQGKSMPGAAFLPNESYGDRSTPYSTSEYRRKSW
ncbi:MAG TPA: glycine zipper domain-containing protein [Hymenobacter sp.]|jgi:phage tail tape-measure protein